MSYLPFSFLIVLCSLNTRGPRVILSSDSYPLDHSPVVIELLFGTFSVPVTFLSLRSILRGFSKLLFFFSYYYYTPMLIFF
ncbi:hypothetical protein HETIRDRAFT_309539 [Heterobasidion irregulare TC 32-1]|uniref:Uncharacterized protein n=1 Tax=Heterobasidion irregulare (strain TC 32-1) TaxID=747525 RepID=W4KIR7_HETIT|nr:uncharacterized protein HETIRDRAFT_309539 [Heterobasidion irregulare TC 32-1]ETW85604.1 hypothetical protein HETIRDRAFT_309539 [Heterobasidion irregulare TC 32-1]